MSTVLVCRRTSSTPLSNRLSTLLLYDKCLYANQCLHECVCAHILLREYTFYVTVVKSRCEDHLSSIITRVGVIAGRPPSQGQSPSCTPPLKYCRTVPFHANAHVCLTHACIRKCTPHTHLHARVVADVTRYPLVTAISASAVANGQSWPARKVMCVCLGIMSLMTIMPASGTRATAINEPTHVPPCAQTCASCGGGACTYQIDKGGAYSSNGIERVEHEETNDGCKVGCNHSGTHRVRYIACLPCHRTSADAVRTRHASDGNIDSVTMNTQQIIPESPAICSNRHWLNRCASCLARNDAYAWR
jgi:hypothetical protein